jgi:hypothetical protein
MFIYYWSFLPKIKKNKKCVCCLLYTERRGERERGVTAVPNGAFFLRHLPLTKKNSSRLKTAAFTVKKRRAPTLSNSVLS